MKSYREALLLVTIISLGVVLVAATRTSTSANSIVTPANVTIADDPCAALTPGAFTDVIAAIDRSRAAADNDVAANGSSGAYASAARDNVAKLMEARDRIVALQTALGEHLRSPHLTNATSAYTIHEPKRTPEVVASLYSARHWASVSAANHRSDDARKSFELTTQAIALVEALGANGGRCYMSGYFR